LGLVRPLMKLKDQTELHTEAHDQLVLLLLDFPKASCLVTSKSGKNRDDREYHGGGPIIGRGCIPQPNSGY